MAGEAMDIETAEQRLKAMDHSEQHYFNRYVFALAQSARMHFDPKANYLTAITTMVSNSCCINFEERKLAHVIAPIRYPRGDVER